MSLQRSSRLKVLHAPQTDLAVEASWREQVELWDRKQVHDGLRVEVVFVLLRRVVALTHAILLQVLHIVGMDSSLEAACEESASFSSFAAPLDYKINDRVNSGDSNLLQS